MISRCGEENDKEVKCDWNGPSIVVTPDQATQRAVENSRNDIRCLNSDEDSVRIERMNSNWLRTIDISNDYNKLDSDDATCKLRNLQYINELKISKLKRSVCFLHEFAILQYYTQHRR